VGLELKRVNQKWNNPDAAVVMNAIESLRQLVILIGVVVVASLLLNASRTYLVSTQINKLQAENIRLNKEMGKCEIRGK
jgi:hypothetical protein